MRKTLTLILLLAASTAQAQTYDDPITSSAVNFQRQDEMQQQMDSLQQQNTLLQQQQQEYDNQSPQEHLTGCGGMHTCY